MLVEKSVVGNGGTWVLLKDRREELPSAKGGKKGSVTVEYFYDVHGVVGLVRIRGDWLRRSVWRVEGSLREQF